MYKYWTVFKTSYQENVTYRGSVFIRLIRDVLLTLFFIVLWAQLFKQTSNIGGYTFKSITTYYILVRLMDQLYSFQTTRLLNEDIVDGTISFFLMKPMNYMKYLASYVLGRRAARTTLTFLLIIGIFAFFRDYVAFPVNPQVFAIFVLFAILAWLLYFEIAYLLGVISFWFSEASDLRSVLEHIMLILGGLWIPIDLFPPTVVQIINFLPFKYLYSSLVQIYEGKVSLPELLIMFFIEIAWIITFHQLGKYLFSKGLKTYASFGN